MKFCELWWDFVQSADKACSLVSKFQNTIVRTKHRFDKLQMRLPLNFNFLTYSDSF